MLALQIDNPTIENYFHDSNTIKKVLEFIAVNKIIIDKNILSNESYQLWSKSELDHISKVDLSTPLNDDEDYSKW